MKDILKLSRVSILDIQLGNPNTEELFGHERDCQLFRCEFSDCPAGRIPRLDRLDFGGGFRNRDYYKDVAAYTQHCNLSQRFAFAITNNSKRTLESPRLEVVIDTIDITILAFDEDSFPDEPSEHLRLAGIVPTFLAKQNRRNFASLKHTDDRTIIRIELEDIQAKRTAWSTCCYLGTGADRITLSCRLYADNLSQPFEQQLTMSFTIGEQCKTLQEWIDAGFRATPVESPSPKETEE